MNKLNIHYAVLQYIPDQIRHESINIGIVFHIPEQEKSFFISAKNKQRIRSFDDEFDNEYFDTLMASLHFEFDFPFTGKNNDLYDDWNDGRFDDIKNDYFLDHRIGYYVNDIIFLPPNVLPSDETKYKEDIDALEKTYLYYDRPIKERISKSEVKSLLYRQLRVRHIRPQKKADTIQDPFSETPIFDYVLGDRSIKVISFDYEKVVSLSNQLKSALFDIASVLKESPTKRIQFVTNEDLKRTNYPQYQTFKKSLQTLSKEYPKSKISVNTVSEFLNT